MEQLKEISAAVVGKAYSSTTQEGCERSTRNARSRFVRKILARSYVISGMKIPLDFDELAFSAESIWSEIPTRELANCIRKVFKNENFFSIAAVVKAWERIRIERRERPWEAFDKTRHLQVSPPPPATPEEVQEVFSEFYKRMGWKK